MKRYAMMVYLMLWLPLMGWAQTTEPFQAGKDYQIISQQQTSETVDGKVEVIEFFNYGCPGCFFVESAVKQWLMEAPDSLHFQRTPVVLTPQWRSYARAYHAAQRLNMEHQLSPALFAAIHEQKRNLTHDQAIIAFFMEQGVTSEQIERAFDSQFLKTRLSEDIKKIRTYRTNAIPGFGVGGQYRTDLAMAKNDPQRMMKIVDFLVMKSQAAQPPTTSIKVMDGEAVEPSNDIMDDEAVEPSNDIMDDEAVKPSVEIMDEETTEPSVEIMDDEATDNAVEIEEDDDIVID